MTHLPPCTDAVFTSAAETLSRVSEPTPDESEPSLTESEAYSDVISSPPALIMDHQHRSKDIGDLFQAASKANHALEQAIRRSWNRSNTLTHSTSTLIQQSRSQSLMHKY